MKTAWKTGKVRKTQFSVSTMKTAWKTGKVRKTQFSAWKGTENSVFCLEYMK